MKVYLFPGQGAQRKGMGEDLFEEFKDLTQKADEILGYSIKELCLEDSDGRLVQTQFTQPAVYVVNALSYLNKSRTNPKPDYVLGHSVGEYNALLASGVLDFENGLKLVNKRGQLMSKATDGGMAAVMGLSADQVEEILKEKNLNHLCIANYNSPHQVVISGLKKDIEKAEPLFLEMGATHYRILSVGGAFHTSYMADAKKKFKKFVKKFKFGEITIPIISNVTARPYKQGEIKDNLIEQITTPVRWTESTRYLLAKGVDIEEFEEIGVEGLSVVKALAIRTSHEVGPLDVVDLEAEEKEEMQETKEKKKQKPEQIEEIKEMKETRETREKEGEVEEKIPKEAEQKKTKEQPPGIQSNTFNPDSLGSKEFRDRYHLKYAYLAGGMYKGIASKALVVRMGKAGFMGFFGTGGLELPRVEEAIQSIRKELSDGQAFGMNLVSNPFDPQYEEKTVDLFLQYGIAKIEAAAYMQMTPALVRYRGKGLTRDSKGEIVFTNKIIAKVSRPEVAEQFLSPAPERIVKKLLEANKINRQEADLLKEVPMADDLCVEADSGGHTDQGMPYALMPTMIKLRDEMMKKYGYAKKVHVGAAGGIGTPEAAAAAFILGADFILTGSVNQCSVESGTSDAVKDMLQEINVQDTAYAPAADMFEMGAKIQVLKKGVFFPARANKLYDLYRLYNSIEEIDEKTKKQLQERYFKQSFEEIYQVVKSSCPPEEIERAEGNPKHKMALIFKWYFGYTTRLALEGNTEHKVDFQVHCGPSLGAFNQWVKGTAWENWRNRHVDEIAEKIMQEAADVLDQRFHSLTEK
jgi:trans-AT polyketide synthase/acyltransferase/oxidoreductase domain-containing protein